MKLGLTLTALLTGTALMASAATAQEFRLAPAAPPAHPAYYMYEHFLEYLAEESGGTMTGTILGPEVVALPQMADALRSGLADAGNVLPLYFSADFPLTGVSGDLALLGRSPHAMALAMTEWTVNCAECQAEFNTFGAVFTGAGSSDVYGIITTQPIGSVEDLQGLRLRSGGAPYSRWAENFGATGVPMSVNDIFEAMNQGTVDGTIASVVDMLSFRLVDIATDMTLVPLGTYHCNSNFTVANGTWANMSVEQRGMFLRAANRANFDLTDRWAFQLPEAARAAVGESDITVVDGSPELLAASDAFVQADAAAVIEASGESAANFVRLVEEWTEIVDGIGNDPDALADIAWERIWSQVDLTTYGL